MEHILRKTMLFSSGDNVMGLVPEGALGSTVKADPDLLWPVPQHWSLEDAATVPLAYVHAYYCLVRFCVHTTWSCFETVRKSFRFFICILFNRIPHSKALRKQIRNDSNTQSNINNLNHDLTDWLHAQNNLMLRTPFVMVCF